MRELMYLYFRVRYIEFFMVKNKTILLFFLIIQTVKTNNMC